MGDEVFVPAVKVGSKLGNASWSQASGERLMVLTAYEGVVDKLGITRVQSRTVAIQIDKTERSWNNRHRRWFSAQNIGVTRKCLLNT